MFFFSTSDFPQTHLLLLISKLDFYVSVKNLRRCIEYITIEKKIECIKKYKISKTDL